MRKLLSRLVLATALSAIAAPALAETSVGLLLPTSGPYAGPGNEIADGFLFAIEEAGRKDDIKILREDTEVRPPVGLAKARKLVFQDKVDVIAGIMSSGVLAAVRNFVHDSKVPLIIANAGNNAATGADCSPYITRVSFSVDQVSRPLGPWMYEQGIRKVYTLAPDYIAGRQVVEAFTKAFTEAGGEIIGSQFTPFGQTQDFGPYLTAARSAKPDAIFVFYAGREAISFVKQFGSFGIAEEIPLYGTGFLTSPLYVAAEGDAAVGVKASLHYVPTLDTPENKTFVAAFKERFGRVPSEYAVQGYDAARLVLGALDAGATDRASLAAALPKVSYTGRAAR